MPPSGRIEIVNSTLSGNASGGGGAAVNNAHNGTILILGSKVNDNPGLMIPDPTFVDDPLDPHDHAELVPAPGVYEPDSSAIVNEAEFDTVGTILIADSEVSRNTADTDGAGVNNNGHGTLIIERSKFVGNRTHANGGGINSAGGILTITDSLISDNQAHGGGGIASAGESNLIGLRSRVTITNTRVAGNDAEAVPGVLPPRPTSPKRRAAASSSRAAPVIR
jgi:hypothetical protein